MKSLTKILRQEASVNMKITYFLAGIVAVFSSSVYAASPSCKCFPGDACWPSDIEWKKLNSSVDGRLIRTEPLGSPCHDPTYDAEECKKLQDQWQSPLIQ